MILLRRYGTLFALALIVLVFTIASPQAFGTMSNLVNITQQMSLLAIVAIGAELHRVMGWSKARVGAHKELTRRKPADPVVNMGQLRTAVLAAIESRGLGSASRRPASRPGNWAHTAS